MTQGPDRWAGLRRGVRLPLGGRGVRDEVGAELRFHLEERIEELVASGLSRAEAVREARARFGDLPRIARAGGGGGRGGGGGGGAGWAAGGGGGGGGGGAAGGGGRPRPPTPPLSRAD